MIEPLDGVLVVRLFGPAIEPAGPEFRDERRLAWLVLLQFGEVLQRVAIQISSLKDRVVLVNVCE